MKDKKMIYEITTMIFSIIVVIIVIVQMVYNLSPSINRILNIIEFIIWLIFVVEFVVGISKVKKKKEYILSHKLDLLAIIPLHSLFRGFRLFRLFNLIKLFAFLKKFIDKLNSFIKTNNFNYVLIAASVTVLGGSVAVSILEKIPFFDALWWGIVTVTTVGYGDITPKTLGGRIVASIVMLVGIGFLSTLTSTISTYFLSKRAKASNYQTELIDQIKDKLDDFDNLSKEDLDTMVRLLYTLKKTTSEQIE